MSATRIISIIIGVILIILGIPILIMAAIPTPLSAFFLLFALLFLLAGGLLIYYGVELFPRKEATQHPVTPAPYVVSSPQLQTTTQVRSRLTEETVLSSSTPSVGTLTRLATLSSPRGNLYVTSIVQEFGRSNFLGIVPSGELNLISRRHFRTHLQGGKLFIEDLGSANGTFVNGVDIRGRGMVPLERGDKVNVAGVVEFTVEY